VQFIVVIVASLITADRISYIPNSLDLSTILQKKQSKSEEDMAQLSTCHSYHPDNQNFISTNRITSICHPGMIQKVVMGLCLQEITTISSEHKDSGIESV
jgi:hypothetical protein